MRARTIVLCHREAMFLSPSQITAIELGGVASKCGYRVGVGGCIELEEAAVWRQAQPSRRRYAIALQSATRGPTRQWAHHVWSARGRYH
eukprot:scaffold21936_cov35-Tisochrysis_lutea.AAC.1